jgi:hypothetical protein
MSNGKICSTSIKIGSFGVVDTVGKNTKKITEYIKNQLREDKLGSQLPFEKSPWDRKK